MKEEKESIKNTFLWQFTIPGLISILLYILMPMENWAESLSEFGGPGGVHGWAGYVTLFPRLISNSLLGNFPQTQIPALFRISTCIATAAALSTSISVNKYHNVSNTKFRVTSAGIALASLAILAQRQNIALSSISYIFFLPSTVLFIGSKFTTKASTEKGRRATNNIAGFFLLLGTLSKPFLATPILIINPFNKYLKAFIGIAFSYQIFTQMNKAGGGITSGTKSLIDLILAVPVNTSMLAIKSLSGYSIPYSSSDAPISLVLAASLILTLASLVYIMIKILNRSTGWKDKRDTLLIYILFSSFSIYFLQESIRSSETGLASIIKTSYYLIFGDRKPQITLITAPATIFLALNMSMNIARDLSLKLITNCFWGLAIIVNLNSATNSYRESIGFSQITMAAKNIAIKNDYKFCTIIEPYFNWELHPYKSEIEEYDKISASNSWRYGGCIIQGFYKYYSIQNNFFEKMELTDETAKLLKNKSDFLTIISYAKKNSHKTRTLLKNEPIVTQMITHDKKNIVTKMYHIRNGRSRRELIKIINELGPKSIFNLSIIELRKSPSV